MDRKIVLPDKVKPSGKVYDLSPERQIDLIDSNFWIYIRVTLKIKEEKFH